MRGSHRARADNSVRLHMWSLRALGNETAERVAHGLQAAAVSLAIEPPDCGP
jgi:hypothetical protein